MNHPRTRESPMDWEYNGTGPCDPSSPFTHVAQKSSVFSGFSSPSKGHGRPNPFANPSSPSKAQPPSTPRFTPQMPMKSTAPPFRNPAFTTPRRPIDEAIFSEASGAEDSPALTEASDVPNDTPEVDHMGDVAMGGVITPTKVSKAARYGRSTHAKKQSSGKGEIKNNRDSSRSGLLRKRKRHNLDRDVSSVVKYQQQGESDEETDTSGYSDGRSQRQKGAVKKRGIVGTLFSMLDEHPNAPENLHRWIQLLINVLVATTVIGIGWSVVATIRSDIRNANEAARLEIVSQIEQCNIDYTANSCAARNIPALRAQCDAWYDCMMQNPASIMRVKVTAKQIAEIINEFSEAMNFKAWGFFFAVVILCVFGNNLILGRGASGSGHAASYQGQHQKNNMHGRGDDNNVMWMPVQTPRMNRHALLDDGSDTDSSLPRATPLMLPHYTPGGRRSPSKGERARSPIKYSRSPSKGY